MAIRRFSTSNLTGGKSSKLWDQETALGTFESIAVLTGTSNIANGSGFSNIPQNYSHLQLRCIFRAPSADSTSGSMSVRIQFNGDSSSVYADHNITGTGTSTITSGYNTSQARSFIAFTAGNGNAAGLFSTAIIDIFDYTSTTKNKVIRSFSGADTNSTSGQIMIGSGLWASTSAINSIALLGDGGPSGGFGAGTHVALYGIRGA